jgi:ADP-ribosylglycohydrolase
MRDLAAGQHWALAGARGEFAAGNGAAMRIAPLAFFGDVGDPSFARLVRDVAGITHRNDEAITGAVAILSGMQHLAAGRAGREVLSALIEELPDTALSDSLAVLASLPEDATALDAANRIGTSGRTAQSVALALFIGCSVSDIEIAIRDAIRCGGDTDTIASLAAQLRAASGEQLPSEWLPHLPIDEVRALCASLLRRERARPRRRRWGLF